MKAKLCLFLYQYPPFVDKIIFVLCPLNYFDTFIENQLAIYVLEPSFQLLIVKFRLKLKKAGKTTRSIRYDLNPL